MKATRDLERMKMFARLRKRDREYDMNFPDHPGRVEYKGRMSLSSAKMLEASICGRYH